MERKLRTDRRADLTGQRHWLMRPLELAEGRGVKGKGACWKCVCDCGEEFYAWRKPIRWGKVRHCGKKECKAKAAKVLRDGTPKPPKPKKECSRSARGERYCQRCKQWKPMIEFQRKSICIACCGFTRPARRSLVKRVASRCGCMNPTCPTAKPIPTCAIDFHHVDPSTKSFDVSHVHKNGSMTLEEIVCEVEKCVTLCAVCHRLVHMGLASIEGIPRCRVLPEEFENIDAHQWIDRKRQDWWRCDWHLSASSG